MAGLTTSRECRSGDEQVIFGCGNLGDRVTLSAEKAA